MKLWFKKLFVLIVAIMTLGFYVPPLDLEINADTNGKETESNKNTAENPNTFIYDPPIYLDDLDDYETTDQDPAAELIEEAKDHMIGKLGPKIHTQLRDEISEQVLPNLELVVSNLIDTNCSDQQFNLSIIENRVSGYGEKIFDLYDEESEKIIAKFHVRRENRPLDGYWFNFHYHLAQDQFETHYEFADIYWSKDTPPKWMS
ncbi:YpjP family protein [Amphibacillus indicireducens]|uniref:YpjP family protein n=1 Tax=Amphibacillus indicireducens TaxID=1076330 RepID=A0ABP7V266_9BACI